MEDKNQDVNEQRRSVLKKMAVGAGVLAGFAALPERWTTPIVGQIVLPAHAGTSGTSLNDPCSVTLTSGTTGTATVTVLVTGFVTPPTAAVPVHIVATATGGAGSSVSGDTTTDASGNFSMSLTVTGGPGITRVDTTTTVTGAAGAARCFVIVTAEPPKPPEEPTVPLVLSGCAVTKSPAGDESNEASTVPFTVTGSVAPAKAGVPVHIVITPLKWFDQPLTPIIIDTTTNSSGNYSVTGTATGGPGITGAMVTTSSSVASGGGKCFVSCCHGTPPSFY
jgi:hypothetical protein